MSLISSHTLNGVDGTHAGHIPVRLIRVASQKILFETQMDAGGRLSQSIDSGAIEQNGTYELVFETTAYWKSRELPRHGAQIMDQIVIRFSMPNPDGKYHIPVIISPNSCSVWLSGE